MIKDKHIAIAVGLIFFFVVFFLGISSATTSCPFNPSSSNSQNQTKQNGTESNVQKSEARDMLFIGCSGAF